MNYQEIFKIALLLISSPAKAWEEIRLEEDKKKVLGGFVYPMIGLCALSVFLGVLFTHGWGEPLSFQIAMTKCCILAVALFGGYFLASYIINELAFRFFGLDKDLPLIQQFAGYALIVTFVSNIITGLFPDFIFLALLFQFYIVYIVWIGANILLGIQDNYRMSFTLVSSFILIACPTTIQFLFGNLLNILN